PPHSFQASRLPPASPALRFQPRSAISPAASSEYALAVSKRLGGVAPAPTLLGVAGTVASPPSPPTELTASVEFALGSTGDEGNFRGSTFTLPAPLELLHWCGSAFGVTQVTQPSGLCEMRITRLPPCARLPNST